MGVQGPGNGSSWQAVLGSSSRRLTLSLVLVVSCPPPSFPPPPSKPLLGHIYILEWVVLQGTVNLPIIRHQLSVLKIYLLHDGDIFE